MCKCKYACVDITGNCHFTIKNQDRKYSKFFVCLLFLGTLMTPTLYSFSHTCRLFVSSKSAIREISFSHKHKSKYHPSQNFNKFHLFFTSLSTNIFFFLRFTTLFLSIRKLIFKVYKYLKL